MTEEKTITDDDGYRFVDLLENGKIIRSRLFNPEGNLVSDTIYRFSENGEYKGWENYDSTGNLEHRYEFTFDYNGLRKEVICYDKEGVVKSIRPHDGTKKGSNYL